MVAFRKLFPVLAIAALLLGSSVANAQVAGQPPLTCTANAGVPPLVRAEGLTELVGDLVLVCTGGNPAVPFLANFQLFLNTNITSRLLVSPSGTAPGLTDALLMIDEPLVPRADAPGGGATPATPMCLAPVGTAVPGDQNSAGGPGSPLAPPGCNPVGGGGASTFQRGTYTAFRANTTGQFSAIVWPGIPVTPPGTTGSRVFRITNVRANASAIGAASTLIPNQITAFISVSTSQTVALNNPQQTVAYVQRGLVFDVRNCGNTGGGNPALAQCVSANTSLFRDPNRREATTSTFAVRFTEGFQTAFKKQIETDPARLGASPPQTQSVPGVGYNTESGFVRTDIAEFGVIGQANTGTRVAARFRDVPADVQLYATVLQVGGEPPAAGGPAPAPTTGAPSTARARLVQAGPNGEGSFFPINATTSLNCGGITVGAAQIPVTGGQAVAVWEVIDANPSAIDTLFFHMAVAYVANPATPTPPVGQARVAGTFAPFYAGANDLSNVAGRWSATHQIPRFLESTELVNAFRIEACETNLLFPFVTAQAGFDTGIAISNTSADHFDDPADRRQGGRCTLHYFGNVTGGGNPPNPQTTNADIPAGGQLTFVLSSGGNFGIAGTPGFQGYIFARCLFRYAHGFAFVTDGPIGQARVAEGYLALVVTEDPFDTDRGTDAESLGN